LVELSTGLSIIALVLSIAFSANAARVRAIMRREHLRLCQTVAKHWADVEALKSKPNERETRLAKCETDIEDVMVRISRLYGRVSRDKRVDKPEPAPVAATDIKARLRQQVGLTPRTNGGD
jgi:hypothetical protein